MKKYFVKYYKIKKDDNLSLIAKKFKKEPTELLIQNKISPKQIFEGNVIFINN